MPITDFYHPERKTKPGLRLGCKTFNAKYIKLLLKSKTFKNDIKDYHSLFFDECIKERAKKIMSFTSSIRRVMSRSSEDSK